MSVRPRHKTLACALGVALGLSACATLQGSAETYSQHGDHHLAIHYLVGVYRHAPGDPSAQARLVQELTRARALWTARRDDLEGKGQPTLALAEAKRVEEISHLATDLGLPGFEPDEPAREVARLSRAVGKLALARVDETTAAGGSPGERLIALRSALAVRPHDGEIQGRYEDLRRRMVRHMSIRTACDPGLQELCREVSGRVARSLTAARRELVDLVGDDAPLRDSELVIQLSVETSDTDWRDQNRGVAEAHIPRLNHYKEPTLNRAGKPVIDAVRATYVVRARTTWARAVLSMTVQGLRAGEARLWSGSRQAEERSTARYYDWTGDHRALEGLAYGAIVGAGTNRTGPTHPGELTRVTVEAVCDSLTPEMIRTLEATQ